MNITAMGTTLAAHTHAVAAAAATASQGAFGAQLQSWMASQSSAGGSAGQTASLTEPGRGTPDAGHHHHQTTSGSDTNMANNPSNGQATSGAPGAMASGNAGAGQQSSGSLLLNDMMRGLQAYGSTTAMM